MPGFALILSQPSQVRIFCSPTTSITQVAIACGLGHCSQIGASAQLLTILVVLAGLRLSNWL